MTSSDGTNTLRVDNVQSFGGYVLHIGVLESGALQVGDTVTCMVDYERRWVMRVRFRVEAWGSERGWEWSWSQDRIWGSGVMRALHLIP